jgi:hypothetical protein
MTATLPTTDRAVLRELAKQLAEIAALPVHAEKKEMWRRLNGLDPVRPMILLYNDTWHETPDLITLQCTDEFCRWQELSLRRTLYNWEHTFGDSMIDPVMWAPIVTHQTGWGVEIDYQKPADHVFGAAHFEPVIREEKDIERLTPPVVTVDRAETERVYQLYTDLYGDIMPVKQRGNCWTWFAIFDHFIQWRGLEQAFEDMYDRPEWLHRVLDIMTEGMIGVIETLEREGALGLNNGDEGFCGVGPGGFGVTDLLPAADYAGTARTKDMWGHATTQIFADVSPDMHEEFALQYEARYLNRFGFAGYGCCEPLHRKVDIVKKHLPRLRRLSMSPWVDVAAGAQALGNTAVFSYKPNPAVLGINWDPEYVRAGLREVCEKTRGCSVEIIMKDLHTTDKQPQRMDEWVQIAMEVAEEFAV